MRKPFFSLVPRAPIWNVKNQLRVLCFALMARPRLDKTKQGAGSKISLSSGVSWVNAGLPFHWQIWCLLQSWLHIIPATRCAENNPLVTKPLWATTFLSVEFTVWGPHHLLGSEAFVQKVSTPVTVLSVPACREG